MKNFIFFAILSFIIPSIFAASDQSSQLENSRQLLVVTVDGYKGKLQRFDRKKPNASWKKVDPEIAVLAGKLGLVPPTKKHEGDAKTPAGTYSIGPAFGFGPGYLKKIRLPYLQLSEDSICINDPKSQYYNQMLNSNKIMNKDWNRSENMRSMPQYLWGISINYNQPKTAMMGSCLTFHIWQNKNKGTTGGIAMSEPDIEQLITWIDPKKHPYVIIIPKKEYKLLKNSEKLPFKA